MDSNLSIATIRSLCIDMINKANSGHPGMVLDGAPALYTLFTKVMNINPSLSSWQNRDRFVLASGHASSLLYALLHLSGYDLSLDDLKQFRQYELSRGFSHLFPCFLLFLYMRGANSASR